MFPYQPVRSRSPKGFTLIELLVVIAIIAILAAILFPVFAKAREKARQASCQSNGKQISLGLLQYVQDFDEVLPQGAWISSNGSNGATTAPGANPDRWKWMDSIYPYVKNEQVFSCPSNSGSRYTYRGNLAPGATTTNYGSYVYNAAYWGSGDPTTTTSPRGQSIAAVSSPAEVVWITDGPGGGTFEFAWENVAAHPNPLISTTSPRRTQNIVERHTDTVTVVWMDGHVKSHKLEFLNTRNANNIMRYYTIEDD